MLVHEAIDDAVEDGVGDGGCWVVPGEVLGVDELLELLVVVGV